MPALWHLLSCSDYVARSPHYIGCSRCQNTERGMLAHACRQHTPLMLVANVKPGLSTYSDFTVAVTTIDRPAIARLKGHCSVLATFGAFCRKHLALGSVAAVFVAIVSVLLRLSRLPARWAALGVVGIAPGRKEFLLVSAESEGSSAVGTLDRLVLKTHLDDLLFQIVG